jgi:hypothetical protein
MIENMTLTSHPEIISSQSAHIPLPFGGHRVIDDKSYIGGTVVNGYTTIRAALRGQDACEDGVHLSSFATFLIVRDAEQRLPLLRSFKFWLETNVTEYQFTYEPHCLDLYFFKQKDLKKFVKSVLREKGQEITLPFAGGLLKALFTHAEKD